MRYCHFDNLYLLQSHICDRWRFSKILHRSTGFHLEMTGFHCSKTLPMLIALFTETVAQGPMANTVHNFWAMVLECDVHLIVMLTEVSGANKASACIPYWPQNDGSSLEIGDFTITKV